MLEEEGRTNVAGREGVEMILLIGLATLGGARWSRVANKEVFHSGRSISP